MMYSPVPGKKFSRRHDSCYFLITIPNFANISLKIKNFQTLQLFRSRQNLVQREQKNMAKLTKAKKHIWHAILLPFSLYLAGNPLWPIKLIQIIINLVLNNNNCMLRVKLISNCTIVMLKNCKSYTFVSFWHDHRRLVGCCGALLDAVCNSLYIDPSEFNWSFVNRKTYVDQSTKPQVGSNWPNPPPSFLPFGEILGSCHVTWCNFAQVYFMHHWTSHQGPGRKAPSSQTGKFFILDLSITCNFQQLLFSWQKSPPPSISTFSWETQLTLYMWNTHGLHTTNPHSDSSYPNIFFRLPTLSSFQNTYREVQDTRSWCRWKACREPYHNTH